ncbi:NAD-dependent succinate-semialdehyde dehydrogenase [Helicobacter turcicus]|uniref:NAD-dependent succinate-semialdehyde dehydrogenase n=1 Tax=Helicobacter turcicus TaxID=2867412 RepID=A0ABS7JKF6_9HELI|nr:NAD-dependent succinate-semialdehyde dehydrogenase [Helicobacter turcicus]MBX7489871.1 NAD-dependent succinate-semialdehyde dehydrogenase [Helicobacter turcicus]MBX7544731.1 NAD-dependent succinate-semialdehyde dehydrogenase [Helicobacter turcicus]
MDLFAHKDILKNKIENTIEVKNPATQEILAYIKKTDKDVLAEIINKADKAQKEWANILSEERADILMRFYYLMLEHKDILAEIMTKEQGKPISEAQGEIIYAASFIKWFAQQARHVCGDIMESKMQGQRLMTIKQPIGVCAAITPWNFPSAMITRKIAPALASGCAIIVKSASLTPLSAYALELLAKEAGIPKDVFVVVNGDSNVVSDVLCGSEIIRKLSFTGSTEVGAQLYAKCAKTIKKLSMELGGNAPFIVFDDANLQEAIEGIMASKFRNSGQTCVCANRIYVQSGIYSKLCVELEKAMRGLKVGNGLENGVNQGPLINQNALEKVKEHIADALKKGAKLLYGGKEHRLGGTYFEPTLLCDVESNMLVAKEETFGPLAPIFKFNTEEEVIAMANDTEFGLAAYFFTQDYKRQWRLAESLEYGMVGINTGLISNEVAPFGGVKHSGLGREGSKYGLEEYMELKYLCLSLK